MTLALYNFIIIYNKKEINNYVGIFVFGLWPITSLKQTRSFFSRQKHFSFKVLYFFSIFLLFAFINFFEIYNINSLNKKISHIQVEQLNNVSNDSFDAKQDNLELNVLYKKIKSSYISLIFCF